MCDDNDGCEQLEAEPILTNQQLLGFNIRSRDVRWETYVKPIRPRGTSCYYLQRQYSLLGSYREPVRNHNRRKVLVCHDMMGNYMEDRHYHSSRKYDDYRFYHWNCIDYFCYFSHKYITIPPCGWINAAHKHGVVVLGTFITEGEEGSRKLEEVLASVQMVDRVVAAMMKLLKHFLFDGWLINIECPVKKELVNKLIYFVRTLRMAVEREIDFGAVIWYDSVTNDGQLIWQNTINSRNENFFAVSSGMLVNYGWNDESLNRTRTLCEQDNHQLRKAFFGIDIFGRGQIAKFQTKQTLARIVHYRFSTGFFAPGWVFETLERYGYDIRDPLGNHATNEAFLLRNEKFWWLLWEHLPTHAYNVMPFYTDFCLGSGKKTYEYGLQKITTPPEGGLIDISNRQGKFFNLSRQSLQPSLPLHNLASRYYDDAFNGGSCLRILQPDTCFRLFCTDFNVKKSGLVFAYAYKLNMRDGEIDCVVRFCGGNNARDCYIFMGDYNDTDSFQKGRCYISPFKHKYIDELNKIEDLECPDIPKHLSHQKFEANGWHVRYYVIQFDQPVQVKDIGVLYRKSTVARDTAYLGAIYINDVDLSEHTFTDDSNMVFIKAYQGLKMCNEI